MSKGGKITADIIDVGRSYFLPSAWYGDNILVMETAKAELPHKRGLGGRRPTKYGEKTCSIRLPLSILTELVTNISKLHVIIDY
jgi:hypothetical protein